MTEGWASCPLTRMDFSESVMQIETPIFDGGSRSASISLADFIDSGPITSSGRMTYPFSTKAWLHSSEFSDQSNSPMFTFLALAVKHDGRLVTFDRSIPSTVVRGARPDHLVVL